ncbi:hypothetical protein P171DRAFT_445080 [Karstenula rhodostoma CBS 690.94]|uniref:Lysine-specific metallo-endopeptidase domain-containing protein n=1 Tax=Karstenula rhodostoma CBS 690.94 TaxID=1392251 RepID=A0A9P4PET1_9PLEO|nr:hypothetical protein P171DRAFT_445080 [Karstenula rhodostoma CBS 690.94]
MLLSNPKRALALLLTLGVLQSQAFPQDGAPNSLLPAFTLIGGNGGSETGRCTGANLDNLKASYEDMCLMAQRARDEIDFLVAQARQTGGDGPPRPKNKDAPQEDIDDWQRWNRVRGSFLSMFGKDPFAKREDVQGNPGEIQAGQPIPFYNTLTRGFYNRVFTEYCGGVSAQKMLLCTDADFKFLEIGTVDPGDPQRRNIEDTHPQCRNVGGVWYSPNMPAGLRYDERPPPRNPGDGIVCDGSGADSLAVTVRDWNAIVFCNEGLDTNVHKTITLQDLRGSIKATNRRYRRQEDRDSVLQRIRLGTVTKLEDIKRDDGEIMPVTWMHELNHLVMLNKDQPALDREGNRLKKTGNVYNDDTNQYEDREVDELSYGYELSRNLAVHGGLSGMINPDSISFFALAMFFDEFDWSRGFAMPLKEL